MVASLGCAIHCAAMPFVIAYLPALGLSFLADEAFHKWMALACFVIALTAFIPGLRKHGRLAPVVIGSVGLVLISVAAFGFAGDCCVSCGNGESSANLASASSSPRRATGALDTANACADTCCPDCARETPGTRQTGSQLSSPAAAPQTQLSWLGPIVPWLTPLGGIVLVSAHLLNRRFGCLCGCCETAFSEISKDEAKC
jgi:hypothetical protein